MSIATGIAFGGRKRGSFTSRAGDDRRSGALTLGNRFSHGHHYNRKDQYEDRNRRAEKYWDAFS